jgi:ABC-type dipeptide/oligopeptide/nickel transport system permease subunit
VHNSNLAASPPAFTNTQSLALRPTILARIRKSFISLWNLRAVVRFGLIVLALMLMISLIAPLIAPYGVDQQNLANVLKAPSAKHWLGTDNLGRDVLTRVIYGGRVPLMVAAIATLVAASMGILIGLTAGLLGGWVDQLLMRTADAFICFPALVFTLVMSALIGPGIHNVILSFAIFGWTGFARITRGQVLIVRELQYVEAARAIGMTRRRMLLRHVLPNVLTPLIVAASLTAGGAILVEAGASFLGVGAQPPTASWGRELQNGFRLLEAAPMISFASGLMITLAVLSFNYIGDGLRDLLDPRVER